MAVKSLINLLLFQILLHGIEEFNKKAKKGIEYLLEHGLLSLPLKPEELVNFFKENQRVDKEAVGNYIGDRKNAKVLEAFVRQGENISLMMKERFTTVYN